jgi:hypothetical protein
METAIVSLICIGLIVFGGMTMSQGFLTSVDTTTAGLEQASSQNEQIMRTELSMVAASSDNVGALNVTLLNGGQTKLSSFSNWDVIVQYDGDDGGYYAKWLPYTSGAPGADEWTVGGIYVDGNPEAFEPDILNPGETLEIVATIDPPAEIDTALMVTISTPNGITASVSFVRGN